MRCLSLDVIGLWLVFGITRLLLLLVLLTA